jgi:trehalose 6-phosphate synthase/phosphatase
MMWENPFGVTANVLPQAQSVHSVSSMIEGPTGGSGGGTSGGSTMVDLANLPYRTLDLNVQMAAVMAQEEDRLDKWNAADDPSFRPYQIRDSMQQQEAANSNTTTTASANNSNSMLNKQMSDVSNDSMMADANHDATADTEPPHTRNQPQSKTTPSINQRIFFVCFHLPVVVVKSPTTHKWSASWSESLLAQKEGSKIVANYRAHWIGTITPKSANQSLTPQDRQQIVSLLKDMECTPIFLDPQIQQAHYYGFCKQVLWPAFHNIDLLDLSASGLVSAAKGSGGGGATNKGGGGSSATAAAVHMDDADTMTASDWDQSRLDHWWRAYQQVNQEFATIVNSLVDRSDYLWIHDYHLSLLPRYLASVEPGRYCHKVFFLHIPFPTSQIFRELECGEAILEGMLHADVVGFHAFDHARHFLNAAKRILGLNYESLVGGLIGVNFGGKTVLVSMNNVSIEPKMANGKSLWKEDGLGVDGGGVVGVHFWCQTLTTCVVLVVSFKLLFPLQSHWHCLRSRQTPKL